MKTLVLVDFSNIAHSCWYPALAAEETGKKALEQHVLLCEASKGPGGHPDDCDLAPKQYDAKLVLHTNLGLKLETLKTVLGVEPNYFVFVEDGHADEKYRIFPGYKGARDRNKYDPRPLAKSHIRNSLATKARWLWSPEREADDTLATAALAYLETFKGTPLETEAEVIVVSGDKDLWTVLQYPHIRVYSPAHKAFITPEHIAKAFDGLRDPKYIALFKALWGDSGDSIPNVMPYQKRALMPLFEKCDGTLIDFLEKTDQVVLSDKCQRMLEENLRQVVINDRLARLATDVPLFVPEK